MRKVGDLGVSDKLRVRILISNPDLEMLSSDPGMSLAVRSMGMGGQLVILQ